MKKLCESSLGKIEIANGNIDRPWYEKVKEGLEKSMETTGNSFAGVLVGAVSNFVGGNIGLLYGIGQASVTHNLNNLFEGIEEVNNKLVKPVNNAIRDKIATNEDARFAYDVGYIGGNFVPLLVSLGTGIGIVASAKEGTSVITSVMGGQGALALEQGFVSASQVGQILAATVEGVSSALAIGSGGTSGNKKTPETVDSNKLNHIFGKEEHNLNDFLQSYGGNQEKAYQAIEKATQQHINTNNINDGVMQEVINVNGTNITVRGKIIDGKINIGTAFVAP